MIINQRKRVDDDDDPFDEHGVLKDGRSYRVPFLMMDALQRSIATDGMRVHDGQGAPAGHRPGYVFATDDDSARAAEEAYQQRSAWLRDAYRGGDANVPVRDNRPAPATLADARARADAAYLERSERLSSAWRNP